MRTAMIVMAAMFSLALGQGKPAAPKATPIDVEPGRIAWFDIATTNLSRSRDFYGKLFGWTFAAVQGSDQAVAIVSGATRIGTIRVAEGNLSAFNGVVYVQVTDIRATTAKAKELGATIPEGFPFNLSDGTGAIGLAVDPTGHPIGFHSKTLLPAK